MTHPETNDIPTNSPWPEKRFQRTDFSQTFLSRNNPRKSIMLIQILLHPGGGKYYREEVLATNSNIDTL